MAQDVLHTTLGVICKLGLSLQLLKGYLKVKHSYETSGGLGVRPPVMAYF